MVRAGEVVGVTVQPPLTLTPDVEAELTADERGDGAEGAEHAEGAS